MAKYEGKDHYFDPETGVLKNKLGIRDQEELKKAEAPLVEEMIQASIESFHQGDNSKFAAFIRANLRKLPTSDPNKVVPPKKREKPLEPR
ncbi:MAG: hypothetical protein ABSH17_02990 [Syntrophobacteraceae bacterium]|jgi:fido (protein-threonine AMPylation protein)